MYGRENPPWTANAGQETRSTPKTSAKTIKSETPPRQCISAPYSRLAYRRRKKTPTRRRPAPVFSTMPDHSKNPWHTPAWRQRSRPKVQQGAAKTCPHPPKGPSSGSARPRPYGKRTSARDHPHPVPQREAAPGEAFFQPAAAVSASTDSCKSDMLPPWGNYAVFHNALSIIKRGSPKRAAWGPSRTEAYPSGIRQAGGHNAPPVCRDGRQRRRTCAQFFQKPILRFAVRYHDPPPNYTATKGRLCPFWSKGIRAVQV